MFSFIFLRWKEEGGGKGKKKGFKAGGSLSPAYSSLFTNKSTSRVLLPVYFFAVWWCVRVVGVCSLARQTTEYGTHTECSSKQVTGVLSRVYCVQYIPTYSGVDVRIEQAPQ